LVSSNDSSIFDYNYTHLPFSINLFLTRDKDFSLLTTDATVESETRKMFNVVTDLRCHDDSLKWRSH